jgi:phage gp36-like protein
VYVTLAQLAELPGALELAQVASDAHGAVVDAELMEATLLNGDRSAYTPEQIAAADSARARIEQAMTESAAVIDGYLGKRYTLPLAATLPILATWARSIARYRLHASRISDDRTDPIARDYRDAVRFLEQVAAGKFSLGLDDPERAPSAAGDIRIDPGSKVFGRRVLP